MFVSLPLNALRAFEAMARCGTAVDAAAELLVTPGAVHRHVRQLEAQLGYPLFERLPQGFRLTERGRALAAQASASFRSLSDRMRSADAEPRRTLRLGVPRAYAAMVLAPALSRLAALLPDVDIELDGNAQQENPARGGCDAVIRYGQPELLPDFAIEPLPPSAIFPVATPALAAGLPEDPGGWTGRTFLRFLPYDYWSAWAGERVLPPPARLLSFSESSMLYQAAVAGAGLAIGHSHVTAGLLAEGRLLRIGESVADRQRYTLILPRERRDEPELVRLLAFLTDLMAPPPDGSAAG